ncbi:uncharacterized protein ACJ7VT_000728 [Polymixia lowei]
MSGSLLYHSLKVYLNNKNRLQPIIGLGSVAECVKAGSHCREALYLCEVCVCRLGKADIRNHIMGSLHRYNYIKAWHPHFVADWKKSADLSKMAWPLMEMAQLLERREGPGDVQVLELEAAVYQEMASHSETNAITLLNAIRHGQTQIRTQCHSETPSAQLEDCSVQSQRIVLPPQKLPVQSNKPSVQTLKSFVQLPKATVQTDKCPSMTQSTAAHSVKLKDQSERAFVTLQSGNNQKLLEPSVQSENSNDFLHGYTETKPLIGLDRVVECRSGEDGHANCFLCHCCRLKSIKDDIMAHLTGSSHLYNYMMEVYPERVAGINGNDQLLHSVAKKVEQEEGRGHVKVMRLPASLCILLTGNSYHWCKKMLSHGNDWTSTSIHKKKAATGLAVGVTEASDRGTAEKHAAVLSKWTKKKKKRRKTGDVTSPVFKVSLPLTKGSMLLERTSFSLDNIPVVTTCSPPAKPAPSPSPEPLTVDSELDSGPLTLNQDEHTTSIIHTSSQPRDGFFSGDADRCVEVRRLEQERNIKVVQYQEEGGYFADGRCFDQLENMNGWSPSRDQQPEKTNAYEKRNGGDIYHARGGLIKSIYNNWHSEGPYREEKDPPVGVYLTRERSTFNPYRRGGETSAEEEQQYNSDFQNKVGLKVEVPRVEGQGEMSSCASHQQYDQHQPQQHLARDYTSLPVDDVGLHGTGDVGPRSGVHRRMQLFELGQRGLLNSGGVQLFSGYAQTAPHVYMVPPAACPSFQVGHGVISDPYYNDGRESHPDLRLPPPNGNNVFIPLEQAQGYGARPDLYSRGVGSGLSMIPGSIGGVPSAYMATYPSQCPDSAHLAASHWDYIPAQGNADPMAASDPYGSSHTHISQQFF